MKLKVLKQNNMLFRLSVHILFLCLPLFSYSSEYEMKDVITSSSSENPSTKSKLQKIFSATAALLRTDDASFIQPFSLDDAYNFCSNNPFLQQKMFSYCSGTLISKNKILTAGHCIRSLSDCKNIRIAFDYYENKDIERIKYASGGMYKCKKIMTWSKPILQKQLIDYAVIELDRDVVGRDPVEYNDKHKIHDKIISAGHPLGLPMKYLGGYLTESDQKLNQQNILAPFIKVHMNSHPGLSGSGVYNDKYELSGILVRGESNIEKDGHCSRIRNCDKDDCTWADIQKLPKLQ
jgi:V8-like Glu-specific endopeptidase